jgi:hypothetical protein
MLTQFRGPAHVRNQPRLVFGTSGRSIRPLFQALQRFCACQQRGHRHFDPPERRVWLSQS